MIRWLCTLDSFSSTETDPITTDDDTQTLDFAYLSQSWYAVRSRWGRYSVGWVI